jgi:hypothetical protein
MGNFNIFFTSILLCLGSLSAQTFLKHSFPSGNNKNSIQVTASIDTLRVLAIMVDFQYSKDATTTGNGKFDSIYTKDYGKSILDPLPHNKEYFEAHLQFAKNYFAKVSKNNLVIEYEVLPSVITVSKNMKSYSPPIKSSDFSTMTELVSEAWLLAGNTFPTFDFNKFQLFTIFHAGVGRDVSLPGSIGNERDLPSVYLGLNTLRNYLGSSFNGFPIGNTLIKNSIILPQTQNRELDTYSGKYLVQLTFNGLLVSSIASHLGLPDLFDTKTGLSAIGKFGLMDGQSIFAYNGLYPPEPSAWEKVTLGWVQPVEIVNNGSYNLTTEIYSNFSDTVIVKVPINDTEYFLLENRRRDALSNGSVLTIWNDGVYTTKTFAKDTTGYYSFSVDSVSGVVVDVDEFDWAVPGNGIVIWHIDEKIINEKWATNEINADKNMRGVDVEEADGIQDIGRQFQTIFGDIVIGEGSYEDFWFSKNDSKLFANKFDSKSLPNTNSNNGAKSLISFSDFSDSANVMSFRIAFGDSLIQKLYSLQVPFQTPVQEVKVFRKNLIDYYVYRSNKNVAIVSSTDDSVYPLNDFSEKEIALFNNGNNTYLIGVNGNFLNIFLMNDSISIFSHNLGSSISTAPSIIKNISEQAKIFLGTADGKLLQIDLNTITPTFNGIISSENKASEPIKFLSINNNNYSLVSQVLIAGNPDNSIFNYYDNNDRNFSGQGEVTQFSMTKNRLAQDVSIFLIDKRRFEIYLNGVLSTSFNSKWGEINSFGLGDIKQDGENYIVFATGNKLIAINYSGVVADNFPFEIEIESSFLANVLIGDFALDAKSEIIAVTSDGKMFAINGGSGKLVPGFPIAIDEADIINTYFFNHDRKSSISLFNSKGKLNSWVIGATEGTYYWNGRNGCSQNQNFVDVASMVNSINTFFPKNRAYNYPNPVYDAQTYIRYYVSEDSKINIKIFDVAGDMVTELNDFARATIDNETIWNVSNIQSGVYLARIMAESTSGKKESTIIKIAVVK